MRGCSCESHLGGVGGLTITEGAESPSERLDAAERSVVVSWRRAHHGHLPRSVRETPALPNQSIAETVAVRETPGLPYRTFTPPDFYPAGLLPHWTFTRGPVWYGGDRFSVPNLLYRCRASCSSATVRRLSPSVCAARRHSAGQTA